MLKGSILLVALLCASCASFGAKRLVSSHTAYNDAVQLTTTREVLANIVRTRYSDPMQFLAVQSINAQFSVSAGGSATVGGIGQAGTAGSAGGSVGYSDSPTITYVPQSDAAFHRSLYGLMGLDEVIAFALAGRSLEGDAVWQNLSLSFLFAAINGATDFVGGRRNELYDQRVDALVRLLQAGASYQQVPEWDFDTLAIAKEKVTAEDKVEAFRQGLYFIEEDGGENVRLARYRLVVALTLPAPDDPEVREALEDLGVRPGRAQYILRPPLHSVPGVRDPYAIWVTPRSMSDALFVAAQFVDLPDAHAGIAPSLEPQAAGSPPIAPIRIQHSEKEPPFPYRVQHRGYWFYVDDADVQSKLFLEAMVAAYASRVGMKQTDDGQPQLVLPVGGG